MRQPGAVVVALMLHEHLRLVLQTAEGGGVNDAVAVALIAGPRGALVLGPKTAAAFGRMGREPRARRRKELRPQQAAGRVRLGHWPCSAYIDGHDRLSP